MGVYQILRQSYQSWLYYRYFYKKKQVFFEGQRVRFVNDKGRGKVLKVEQNRVLVLTDHGFENYYGPGEIVPEHGLKDMKLSVSSAAAKEKIAADKAKKATVKLSKKHAPEIDLHIENLLDNWQKMSNYDILQYQMRFFRRKFEKFMQQKVTKVIVIHGKGEGVLKSELRHELMKYENVEFLDGSYLDYGIGATEIRIHYGNKR
ncbi:MAG TPA: Smr/MutS family protein [Flavobacteriales bacterium]|nr:Smr/MutS family protein [Flavobacteriales bacterium]